MVHEWLSIMRHGIYADKIYVDVIRDSCNSGYSDICPDLSVYIYYSTYNHLIMIRQQSGTAPLDT